MTNTESSGLPPLYAKPIVLNAKEHAALAFSKAATHGFARRVNFVPVALSEIPQLLPHYPIAFTTGRAPILIAILGARNDENLFVGLDGKWLPNTYVPAYVRRYPFILMAMGDDKLVLGAEMDGEFLGSIGEPLFTGGRPTRVAQGAFRFCSEFKQALEATKQFCSAVYERGLLKNKRSSITTPSGAKFNLTGFAAVDASALDELDNRAANSFRKEHWLGALYCHVASLERLQTFSWRLEERRTA
jgi:SapC